MTHRERVLAALEHREPDRVPMDLGSARFTGMVKPAYERLCRHLGFGETGPMVDRMQQLVEMDERVLQYLDVDARAFGQNPPDEGGDLDLDAERWLDEWGVIRRKPPGCHFYEMETSPLSGNITPQHIARYPFPDPTDPGRFRGLREKAKQLHEQTEYAVIYNARFHVVHMTQYLRGFENWFMDFAQDQNLFHCLMEAVAENLFELNRRALSEVGEFIDIVAFGDDVGQQDRPVCSLASYRKLIRPYHERALDIIHSKTKAKTLYHSCGSVYPFINDFIDMGIDALNPVQVTAKNMEPGRLKREFGDRITFWGGIDSQHLLPQGSPDQVRQEVQRMFELMGKDGGYVLTSVHNIQPDVPTENVLALFQAGRECVYPVHAGSRP
jgi:uroporphyrinogen decarboxylase